VTVNFKLCCPLGSVDFAMPNCTNSGTGKTTVQSKKLGTIMFGKKKRDPEPPAADDSNKVVGDPYKPSPKPRELTWQELGYTSEAEARLAAEEIRIELANSKQRLEQHAHNREILHRMGVIKDL
jgi:hypothetical protein